MSARNSASKAKRYVNVAMMVAVLCVRPGLLTMRSVAVTVVFRLYCAAWQYPGIVLPRSFKISPRTLRVFGRWSVLAGCEWDWHLINNGSWLGHVKPVPHLSTGRGGIDHAKSKIHGHWPLPGSILEIGQSLGTF